MRLCIIVLTLIPQHYYKFNILSTWATKSCPVMPNFSPILVSQIKICVSNPTDMAKVTIKSEKLSPFGGILSIMEQFDSKLSSVTDSTLGMRCKLYGYQYSEIIRWISSFVFSPWHNPNSWLRLSPPHLGNIQTSLILLSVCRQLASPFSSAPRQYSNKFDIALGLSSVWLLLIWLNENVRL